MGSQAVAVDGITINPGTSILVDFLSNNMLKALNQGLISVVNTASANLLSGSAPYTLTTLTDNSTGTSGGYTIAAVTSYASAANAVATLAAQVNALTLLVESLRLDANKAYDMAQTL